MRKHLTLAVSVLLSVATMQADVVKLTTAKTVGEKINIALNAGGQTTLTWGNGDTQIVKFDGYPMEIEVKDAELTLTTEKTLTRFYAPDAGLETLDLAEATSLVRLIVSNNNLETLSLSKNKAIEVVELQNNKLKALSLSARSNPKLEYLNCANNELETLTYPVGSASVLRVLICSGNKLSSTSSMKFAANLETVWMGENALEGSIQLNTAEGLRLLNIEGNKINELALAASTPRLEGLWASGNQLQALDFSAGAPLMKILSVADNQLTQVEWSTGTLSKMDYVNLSGNSLFFTSFPVVSNVKKAVFAPQAPFFFADTVNVNTSFGDENLMLLSNKRLDSNRTFVMYDGQDNELVKSTSGDYNYTRRGVFTFYTHQEQAYFVVTSSRFEGVELQSQPFCVFDPTTGIEEIRMEMLGSAPIYDVQGRVVAADADQLPAGIYIVGGKKIIVK